MLLRSVLASFALLSGVGCAATPPPLAHPETQLPDLFAESGHVTVVAFFATWCPASQDTLAIAQDLWARHREQGLRVVAVHEDERPEAVERFLSENHVGFAVARDRDAELARSLGIRTIPAIVVLDEHGEVHRVVNGYHGEGDRRTAEGAVASALGGASAEAQRRRDALLRSIHAAATPNPDEPPPDADSGGDKEQPEDESM
jgi:thiol-disulfide isomerase/thioredoxin